MYTLRHCISRLFVAAALAAAGAAFAADAKFVLISHAPDSDSWWNTIKNAIKQAGEDFNVESSTTATRPAATWPTWRAWSSRPRRATTTA